jgi:hypothetical protein
VRGLSFLARRGFQVTSLREGNTTEKASSAVRESNSSRVRIAGFSSSAMVYFLKGIFRFVFVKNSLKEFLKNLKTSRWTLFRVQSFLNHIMRGTLNAFTWA